MDYYNQSAQFRCARCGNNMNQGERFCGICGNAVSPMQGYPDPFGNASNSIPRVSKSVYRRKYAPASLRREIMYLSIFGYVLIGILALLGIFINPFNLIDAAIFLGLVLGMHLGMSKGCAIAILVDAIIGCVLNLIFTGSFTGWGWIAVSILALVTFKKMDEHYHAAMAANTQQYPVW